MMIQAALRRRYPLFATEGYRSLQRQPVFYSTNDELSHSHSGFLNRQTFRTVPTVGKFRYFEEGVVVL